MERQALSKNDAVMTWRTVLEIHTKVMDQLGAVLSRHGLSATEFDVLINLGPHECCRHTELAERVILTRTALTRLVDRLCERGLLTRSPDPTDGRAIRVQLTEEGRRVRRAASRSHNEFIAGALNGPLADQIARLREQLRTTTPDDQNPPLTTDH